MGMSTPWGIADYTEVYEPGCTWVGTPSHGGLAVTEKYAFEHLTEAARAKAIHWGDRYFYEEDCRWAVALYELRHLWAEFFGKSFPPVPEPEEYLLKTVSSWDADYLIARGIEPDPTTYAFYLENQKRWGAR